MDKFKLTKEEQAIENELDQYVKVTGAELKEVAEAIAARKKDLTLTLRVNSQDIRKIKRTAKKLGIKYQTYIAEIIHQVAERKQSA